MSDPSKNKNEATCPKCAAMFALGFKRVKTIRNELQHHLYMAHHCDVIESHRIADDLTKDLQQRVWKKQGIAR
jgi:hypothetical protein